MEEFWIGVLLFIVLSPLVFGGLLIGLQKEVRIIHSASGIARSGYVGYSWTYLLFGWFVPVIRGEVGIGVLHLVITFVSFGLSQLIFPFLYNRQYMNRMLTSGWALDSNDPNYEIAREKLNIVS
jgi:CHASE2 domain-containing sensor protein